MSREEDASRREAAHEEWENREFVRRAHMTFLECAMSCLVLDLGTEETAQILEEEARLLRELG